MLSSASPNEKSVVDKTLYDKMDALVALVKRRANNTDRLIRESETRILKKIKNSSPLSLINLNITPPGVNMQGTHGFVVPTQNLTLGNEYTINCSGLFEYLNSISPINGYYIKFSNLDSFDYNNYYDVITGFVVKRGINEPVITLHATVNGGDSQANGLYVYADISPYWKDRSQIDYSAKSSMSYVCGTYS